ncbi:hypothetical protein LTR53_002681 [Teratosphaeriaceae sp. CCFEE 6253]|nr:hypothetical protein LTR53_002681 [Teratosphaeriaceae sp. CCFEE 6253]
MRVTPILLLPTLATALDPRCTQFPIDVTTNATNHVYGVSGIDNDIAAVSFALDVSRWSTLALAATAPSPPELPVSGTFRIHVQLCVPPHGRKREILHLLTHGLFADKQYWDVQEDPAQYSWVQAALEAGYSTLSYDRLGTGLSDKPDAYNIVQGPLQVEILRTITEMALKGTLRPSAGSAPAHTARPFTHIVHVGHSYGSFITSAFIGAYGGLSSAAIVTGYIPNSEGGVYPLAGFGLDYAPTNDPELYGDRSSGYLVPASVSRLQTLFYHRYSETDPSGFTNALLAYGEGVKQPGTDGEFLSTSALNLAYAPAFTGPLQFVEAEFDQVICDGDCRGTFTAAALAAIYPNASSIDVHIQPGAGQPLTFHRNATAGFRVSLDWLAGHGL